MRMNQRTSQARNAVPAVPLAVRLVEAWEAERAQRGRAKRGIRVELKICVSDWGFSPAKSENALRLVERWCLADLRPRRLQPDGSTIEMTLTATDGESLDTVARRLLTRIRAVGHDQECDVDAVIRHRSSGTHWS